MELPSCCCTSIMLIGMLIMLGFVGVSGAASSATVAVGVQSLCRDMGDTWRGRGSRRGLVVVSLIGRKDAHGGELF